MIDKDVWNYQRLELLIEAEVSSDKLPNLNAMLMSVITDKRFRKSPGSEKKHHAYAGGLVVHTREVVENALRLCPGYPAADKLVVFVSALLHDFNKIHEYVLAEDGTITTTDYRKLVRHVAGSHATFLLLVEAYYPEITQRQMVQIEHCILAHHGRSEWGSQVEPQTAEAMIVHLADMLSARVTNLKGE